MVRQEELLKQLKIFADKEAQLRSLWKDATPNETQKVMEWLSNRLAKTGRESQLADHGKPYAGMFDMLATETGNWQSVSEELVESFLECFEDTEWYSWAENLVDATEFAVLSVMTGPAVEDAIDLCLRLVEVAASSEDLDTDLSRHELRLSEFQTQLEGLEAIRKGHVARVSIIGR